MHFKNSLTEYGIFSKVLHWLSALLLFIQIPIGFYLVDLDFGEKRLIFEKIHILFGLSIFYLVIIRLINNIINPPPKLTTSIFIGQKLLAKLNHLLLYLTILSITISGILKKLFNGENLVIFFKDIYIEENFEMADLFYEIHVYSNFIIIILISIHILAVIAHKLFFNDNLIKKLL